MKPSIKFPYGRSHFGSLIKKGYYYVDKTHYIEWLEKAEESYIIFLRPRRFGKSLFVSTLQHYYGVEHQEDFDALFGKYYIGQHPTAERNSYWVLKFNFSGINTETPETTREGFLANIRLGIRQFIRQYLTVAKEEEKFILSSKEANIMLSSFLAILGKKEQRAIYLLIDEYDHFTNELMAFDLESFRGFVSRNDFIRKFYEVIKIGTGEGIIEQIFITGVSPITLDSLTSGFNIGSHLSLELDLNNMMGFSETEVTGMLQQITTPEKVPTILKDMRKWYDGYRFNQAAADNIYNADMVLYFLKAHKRYSKYPNEMLDTNVSSDYGKLRRLFSLKTPVKNYEVLQEIVEGKKQTANIVQEFSFEGSFTRNDFISLLYYLGFLTIERGNRSILSLKVPNHVIQKLYFDFFVTRLIQREELSSQLELLQNSLQEMAYEGNPEVFFRVLEQVLEHLSRRDYQNFEEKHVKSIIIALAIQTNAFFIKSEREYQGGYTDLLFLEKPPFQIDHQYILELKYLKKKDSRQLKSTQQKAKTQLLDYLGSDAELQALKNLQAWTVVVVKDKIHTERVN